MENPTGIDLNIRGENIQELYDWYLSGRLVVNRRYQRKLVWTREEKQHLVDTIARKFPLPLILLAEVMIDGVLKFEIIDGMQRLNAIFSFIENKYAYKDAFFDLETMASTKQFLDEGKIRQLLPELNRGLCTSIANYKIPISTYRINKSGEIDEIFRRINSYGRVLSDQEIRQAGVIGPFSDLVRTISTAIRGDVSHDNILLLNSMDSISITNKELEYGINAENILWVRQGILLKEDIRDSQDEEVIADLIAYLVSDEDEKPASSRQARDAFYGRASGQNEDKQAKATARRQHMDNLVARHGAATVEKTLTQTFDFFDEVFGADNIFRKNLNNVSAQHGTPRYFQVVLLAFYELLFVEKLKINDITGLRKSLAGLDEHVNISTGGNWAATNRTKNIAVVKGIIRQYFKKNPQDPVAQIGRREFENLISKSKTEAASYDFKQGLHRLGQNREFDEQAFSSILETICALANLGREKVGYIIIGVADKKADADRVLKLDGLPLVKAGEFYVVGVDREANAYHTNLDKYLQLISDRINSSQLAPEIRIKVTSHLASIDYNGRSVIVIRVEAGQEPCFYGNKLFRRVGSQTIEVPTAEIVPMLRLFSS
ncbi:hypothetical protein FHW83_005725 [Duganella sp. SG902]|uniref:GmrSD restriction endonuclease domain-containing protein n=1 Tax=Duganella sp. SG902 TaxID=2587016 RepID=UPI00159D4BA3|nr:DUF262 domain-containing protein [Duganella sp. SG902]NVM79883.1 hypothetical protein [Duganella sp. SG902]